MDNLIGSGLFNPRLVNPVPLGGLFGTGAQQSGMTQESQAGLAAQASQYAMSALTEREMVAFAHPMYPVRKKVESRVVESTIPQSTHLLYGGN